MNFSVNPLSFQSAKIATPDQQKQFLFQLAQLLSQLAQQVSTLSTPNGLASVLDGYSILNYNALNISASSLGTVSTNQTINCNSAAIVAATFAFSASITLTLNNLGVGVPVSIAVASSGAFTLKMAATLPNGSAYTTINYFTGGAQTSLIATGWVSGGAASRIFTGITNPVGLQMGFV